MTRASVDGGEAVVLCLAPHPSGNAKLVQEAKMPPQPPSAPEPLGGLCSDGRHARRRRKGTVGAMMEVRPELMAGRGVWIGDA